MKREDFEVVIVGAGPAGLSAAIYAGRAKLRVAVLEKLAPGGQLLGTNMIENYPGIIDIAGPNLAERMAEQARLCGAMIRTGSVETLDRVGTSWLVRTREGDEYLAPAIIYAAGGTPKKLGVPGEAEFTGRGVSACAICDGPIFRDRVVAVVGGGDSAVGESVFLSRFARKVHLLNNDDDLDAEPVLQERAFADPKVQIHFNAVVEQIGGKDSVEWVRIRNPKDGIVSTLLVDAVFIYIGWRPNSEVLKGIVNMDERGYVLTDWRMRTSAPGLMAAGDVISTTYRQIANAIANGATAALQAYEYIQHLRAPRAAISLTQNPPPHRRQRKAA